MAITFQGDLEGPAFVLLSSTKGFEVEGFDVQHSQHH